MKFVLNGEVRESQAPLTVAELLVAYDLGARRVAVAINGEVVPKSRRAAVKVGDGDKVEVIQAVGGGA